ncbi:MAG TPA: hypothetical protein VFX28_21585, partial [Methylomirabilota bacterium]|nr:hypothetical protein [Methylomirabilota bacterium]
FLLEAAAESDVEPEVAGALSACLAESCEGMGQELGRGGLYGMILEYQKGMVLLCRVGHEAVLAVGLDDPTALGKVRYHARKALPELLRAV